MCGIIVSTSDIPQNALQFINNRGPDNTHSLNINNINFCSFFITFNRHQNTTTYYSRQYCLYF